MKVLLTSIFGPYAVNDKFGSRLLNPMELYENQVTRVQGVFSLRMFHRSWGLMLIQANIQQPCNLLDFPTLDRFIEEIRGNGQEYDIIGISAIPPNVHKVKKMCELIREYQPQAKIVIGGHVANVGDLADRIDADHIVRGDGVRWFREHLGEKVDAPINHPIILSGYRARTLGAYLPENPKTTAATIIPTVGCPLGCNFCSTSAMFGGKGNFFHFYDTGDSLFRVMSKIEKATGARSFFIMDENFLLYKRRSLRLLELMEKHQKSWSLYVFSSADVLNSYTIEQLVRLGISWVWMGLEGKNSQYGKLKGIKTISLVKKLQSHGIRILGSSIIGLENHTPEKMGAVIDWAVKHNTDFLQFMLYNAIHGTPFYAEMHAKNLLLSEELHDPADSHGQFVFNWNHPNIPMGEESRIIVKAFKKDYEVNGPSIIRVVRTTLRGWIKYKDHPDPRIRKRIGFDAKDLRKGYAAATWAAERWFRTREKNSVVADKLAATFKGLVREFGMIAKLWGMFLGPIVFLLMEREARKLKHGRTFEPPTFYETNRSSLIREHPEKHQLVMARCVPGN